MIKYLFAIGIPFLFFTSCKHDDLTEAIPNENIRPAADFVKNNYEMRLFYAALEKTGYVAQLNGSGPFTVLVPSDAAFNEIGINSPSDLDKMNPDTLKKLIGYHVLPRKLRVSDIPTNGVDVRYATLEGTALYTTLASHEPNNSSVVNDLYFSGVKVDKADVVLANGVLHLLYAVMKPNFNNTAQKWLSGRAEYSVFVKGLKKFNLWDRLDTRAEVTVFAPDNKALESVGITNASLDAMDASKYQGNLLFGCYILYDKHLFISDLDAFSVINSNGAYNYFLDNGYYMTFGSFRTSLSKLGYGLMLRTGATYKDLLIKDVRSSIAVKNDNLCSNGIVHHLVDGLVRPDQAIKN